MRAAALTEPNLAETARDCCRLDDDDRDVTLRIEELPKFLTEKLWNLKRMKKVAIARAVVVVWCSFFVVLSSAQQIPLHEHWMGSISTVHELSSR